MFSIVTSLSPSAGVNRLSEVHPRDPRRSAAEEQVSDLFDQFRLPILRYLLSCRVPLNDGEEIVQETFLLLFQHLREGKSTGNPAGWIFRTAYHLMLKRRDRVARHLRYFDDVDRHPEAAVDMARAPDEVFEQKQRRDTVLAVVRALPEQDRNCLHLRAEGLRYRQIAETLGMSLGAVANSLQRSLERIARSEKR